MVHLLKHWHVKDQRAGFTKKLPKHHTHFNTPSIYFLKQASLFVGQKIILKKACYTRKFIFLGQHFYGRVCLQLEGGRLDQWEGKGGHLPKRSSECPCPWDSPADKTQSLHTRSYFRLCSLPQPQFSLPALTLWFPAVSAQTRDLSDVCSFSSLFFL